MRIVVCALVLAAGCTDLFPCHGDALRVVLTTPDTVTIHVGLSVIATSGEAYGICEAPRFREYDWHATDESIVSVTSEDAIHARITGLLPGTTNVTPRYTSGGASLTPVRVTVIP
jgi:hypothetical protein